MATLRQRLLQRGLMRFRRRRRLGSSRSSPTDASRAAEGTTQFLGAGGDEALVEVEVRSSDRAGTYAHVNCGDWGDSCTAIVERADGSFELVAPTEALLQVRPQRASLACSPYKSGVRIF